ncbi:MAG TPA: MBL fold metallo-hydrolase, partial [Xanthobacteraceae bacterium]|nr:MBL fold metallo-hydrolase [Xanthobacteraceae bacterium]
MSLTFTILGCGSSTGVPRVALGWGECDPKNPKNRRRRCSLLVEQHSDNGCTAVLVDTSPDLRQQLLDAEVSWLDGVVFTHEHADHTHGLDDLRTLVLHKHRRVDVFVDAETSRALTTRFGYCFKTPPGSQYPPIVTEHRIEALREVAIDGEGGRITAIPFLQLHGDINSLGY